MTIVGASAVKIDPAEQYLYTSEPRGHFTGRALCIVSPKNAAQVCQVLACCHELGVAIVPQGGNTGLVGGQTPDMSGKQIVLSLLRLSEIRDIDPVSNTMTLEAGVTLAQAQQTAQSVDRYFPLSLASEGSCTIGGNLATNAGGVHVLSYGVARDLVLGLEVALADGQLLSTIGKLRKDNSGYDLTRLFVGSEGTLGVITAATLKLFPRPQAQTVAFVGLDSPAQALKLLIFLRDALGFGLHAFELIPRFGLELVMRHIPNMRDPLTSIYAWYALIEISSDRKEEISAHVAQLLSQAAADHYIQDATLAASTTQARALWSLRENLSEAQKREGGSVKHDISVAVEDMPAFIDEMNALIKEKFPYARPVPFGHMGDGNLHYNISQPIDADRASFLTHAQDINEIVHALVHKYKGSISAEHGIGRLKRDLLKRVKDPVALDLMQKLKATLDPKGILNPGALL